MRYTVYVKEVWETAVEVEAESPREATEKANKAIEVGEVNSPEYGYTLDPEDWTIRDQNNNFVTIN